MSDDAVRSLAVIGLVAATGAWLSSQLEPAWSTRYLAVLFGPLLLALAATLARGNRWTGLALLGVLAVWLLSSPPADKSNVKTVAADVTPELRAGDLVVSTQPEQVPVLHRYLPPRLVYLTPLGVVADPRITDWRNGLFLLRHGIAERELQPIVDRLVAGQRILLVTPIADGRRRSGSPWLRAVRVRTREWRRAVLADPRLHRIGRAPLDGLGGRRSAVRAEVFAVR
jgi:mannosyltransferase